MLLSTIDPMLGQHVPVKSVAAMLGRHEDTLKLWIVKGLKAEGGKYRRLPAIRVGRSFHVHLEEARRFVAGESFEPVSEAAQ